jgi:DNA-binding IclR family transcriptional regulator
VQPLRRHGGRGDVSGGKDRAAASPRERQVPAVRRAVAILRMLGKGETPLGVNAIARVLGLVPSTCLHILRVLVAEELVAFDAGTKRYTLDAGILSIARSVLRRNSFAEQVQPYLDRISRDFAVTAVGVQLIHLDHMVVVAISRSEQGLQFRVDIGYRFPALISATGRCIAAFGNHPWAGIASRFKALRWANAPSLQTWRREIRETRENGYAIDEGNYIEGVTVLAAPVLRDRRVSGAVVSFAVSEQLRRAGVEAVGEELKRAAERLSHG